ncbi:MAG: L-lactate permease, partial [Nitriliruptoraceae bacterium]
VAEGGTLAAYLGDVSLAAATVHGVVGLLVPLFMVSLLTGFFGEHRRFSDGLAIWPFALFSAAAMIGPYYLTARLLGPEFPSLFGGLIGLAIVVTAARKGFLQPKQSWDFGPRATWGVDWMGTLEPDDATPRQTISSARAWAPYGVLAAVLVLTRIPELGIQSALQSVNPTWSDIFGQGLNAGFQFLYLPGFVFLLAVLVSYPLHGMRRSEITSSWATAGRQLLKAAPPMLIAVPLVRIFINSGERFSASGDLASMPLTMAEGAATAVGSAWPMIATFVGAIGAFAAGSNTISNIMFSQFQFATAEGIGVATAPVVAAQAVGGAAGNMLTVHNVVAAAATVGLVGREGDLMRKVAIPCLYYLAAGGIMSYLIVWGVGFNAGTAGLVVLLLLAGIVISRAIRQRRSIGAEVTAPVRTE